LGRGPSGRASQARKDRKMTKLEAGIHTGIIDRFDLPPIHDHVNKIIVGTFLKVERISAEIRYENKKYTVSNIFEIRVELRLVRGPYDPDIKKIPFSEWESFCNKIEWVSYD